MADYSVLWTLKVPGLPDQPLPILGEELAEELLLSGEFDETTLPNSFSSRKGRLPGRATVIVPYSFVSSLQALSKTTTRFCSLEIKYTRLNLDVEIPSNTIEIKNLVFNGIRELGNDYTGIQADDLCIIDLMDQRLLMERGTDLEPNRFSFNNFSKDNAGSSWQDGVTNEFQDNIPEFLYESIASRFSTLTVNTLNQFLPESEHTPSPKQFMTRVSKDGTDLFYESCIRTENIFFIDKDGTPVIQRLGYVDPSVESALLTRIDSASVTESIFAENIKHKIQFPQVIKAYFWKTVEKQELTEYYRFINQSFELNVNSDADWNPLPETAKQSVYPLTSPSIDEVARSRQLLDGQRGFVTEKYAQEIKAQSEVTPYRFLFNGNIDFDWKSQITEIGYTNNNAGVQTYVSIEPRHGQEFFKMPESRMVHERRINTLDFLGGRNDISSAGVADNWGLFNFSTSYDTEQVFDHCQSNGYVDISNRDTYEVQALNDPARQEVFGFRPGATDDVCRLVLKRPGTYHLNHKGFIWFPQAAETETITLANDPSGTTDAVLYYYPSVVSMWVLTPYLADDSSWNAGQNFIQTGSIISQVNVPEWTVPSLDFGTAWTPVPFTGVIDAETGTIRDPLSELTVATPPGQRIEHFAHTKKFTLTEGLMDNNDYRVELRHVVGIFTNSGAKSSMSADYSLFVNSEGSNQREFGHVRWLGYEEVTPIQFTQLINPSAPLLGDPQGPLQL